jgi:hypothetical protein
MKQKIKPFSQKGFIFAPKSKSEVTTVYLFYIKTTVYILIISISINLKH